jgi:hypothetical protein
MKSINAYEVRGVFRYQVVYDTSAGRKNRYIVQIPTSTEPVVIGRELTTHDAEEVTAAYEETFAKLVWLGDRETALAALQIFTNMDR